MNIIGARRMRWDSEIIDSRFSLADPSALTDMPSPSVRRWRSGRHGNTTLSRLKSLDIFTSSGCLGKELHQGALRPGPGPNDTGGALEGGWRQIASGGRQGAPTAELSAPVAEVAR